MALERQYLTNGLMTLGQMYETTESPNGTAVSFKYLTTSSQTHEKHKNC